jgi:hypothetical protein
MQGFILVSPRSWAMVFPFGFPKPEADPSGLLSHAQCIHLVAVCFEDNDAQASVQILALFT